jgi:hypothetical protein
MSLKIPGSDLSCKRVSSWGKKLWHARLLFADSPVVDVDDEEKFRCRTIALKIIGAGNTADNAIRDWQQQYRELVKTA